MNSASTGEFPLRRRQMIGGLGLVLGTSVFGLPVFGQSVAPNDILKVSMWSEPDSLDPIMGRFAYNHVFLWPVCEALLDFDPQTYRPVPGMADWSVTPDGLHITLKLRQGIKFHDGTALDAKAVKYNLDRARTHPKSVLAVDLQSISDVVVDGPDQVSIILNAVTADVILGCLTDRHGMMQSPTALEAAGDRLATSTIGAGPYRFVRYDVDDRMILERNPDYYREGLPYIKGIELRVVRDRTVGLRTVVAGEQNFIFGLFPDQKKAIDGNPNLVWNSTPAQIAYLLYMNVARPAIRDPRVRQAISKAINRDVINKVTGGGLFELPTSSVLPSQHWAHTDAAADMYKYNPDGAKQLLSAAGVAGGLDIECACYSDPESVRRATIIADNLSRVGIRAKLSPLSPGVASDKYMSEKAFDLQIASWSGRPDPIMTMNAFCSKDSFFNPSNLEPEGYSALVQKTQTANFEHRKKALADLQVAIAEFGSMIPLYYDTQNVVHAVNVEDWKPNLAGKPKFEGVRIH